MKDDHLLLWMDLETTGLDLGSCSILEVGWAITDLNFILVQEPRHLYPESYPVTVGFLRDQQADEYVRNMHAESGLWNALHEADEAGETVTRKIIESTIINDVWKYLNDDGQVTLAGSGVASFDLPLIRREYPDLARFITYYTLDVSVVERFLQARTGTIRHSSKTAVHRVTADIQHSLSVARALNKAIPETAWDALCVEMGDWK